MDTIQLRKKLLSRMETLRQPNGAFIAAPTADYRACWLRDQVYTIFVYYFISDYEKLIQGMHAVFDILHTQRYKMISASPRKGAGEHIHAKYNVVDFSEITQQWGHHQLDAIGLFLHMVADLDFKHINVMRDTRDRELITLLIAYLQAVRYWENADFGMWEEDEFVHASSVGAVVSGLLYLYRQEIVYVPENLIRLGRETLHRTLPNEYVGRDADMALLSLIWPYNIVSRDIREEILSRVKGKLVQEHGLNRYWGDNYYRSDNGISAEWPMGFFWLSIIYSQMNKVEEAKQWFERGIAQITKKGDVPELYKNGHPNEHTPLAWAHAMALIALAKLKVKSEQLSFMVPNIADE
ncbi:MAG: hypothetical protein A3A97_03505 [Candidatus Terrybacteria bacterium RIFCSPLOWO2_01_FULL_40_23]|uniref:GH15-like domain-containing protein n=1 Tax=Candidatus Terrybacteria bacterium RIFCSPLOWO2_01_FULL_40_23 TaxID=1802366 RepID=A0A1G2PPX6_9BACT|nr:MAG: hypothetical protein A3A97_03505 [Candidatus Terrybacteria bacterium RIFCSPLOWO2_01_FULL_40_23]